MAGRPNPHDPWTGVSAGWATISYVLGGLAAGGLLGFLLDKLLGTAKVFLAIGMVAGAAGGIYLIYLRFGKGDDDETG